MADAEFTCPSCGVAQKVKVPTDSCLAFHRCTSCGQLVLPKEGDCCVICSYSDTRCPISMKAV